MSVEKRGEIIVKKYLESNIKGVYDGGESEYENVIENDDCIGKWKL